MHSVPDEKSASARDGYRHISVDGLPILGRGATGECYHLDDETVFSFCRWSERK